MRTVTPEAMVRTRSEAAIVLRADHALAAALLDVASRGAAYLAGFVGVAFQCGNALAVARLMQSLRSLFGESGQQQFEGRHAVAQVVPWSKALDTLVLLHLDLECPFMQDSRELGELPILACATFAPLIR